jgi:hypothetical protein
MIEPRSDSSTQTGSDPVYPMVMAETRRSDSRTEASRRIEGSAGVKDTYDQLAIKRIQLWMGGETTYHPSSQRTTPAQFQPVR